MPTSKYERELRFIDNEVRRLTSAMKTLEAMMPADPTEARKKAEDIADMQQEIATMNARRREIEESFVASGMDIPDISRSMNATVHNAGAFEVVDAEEAEKLAGLAAPKITPIGLEGITAQISDIGNEMADVERRMVAAEIEGRTEELDKLRLMSSSLRERRDALVATAKQMRSEQEAERGGSDEDDDDGYSERIDALESDSRAVRSQLMDLRNEMAEMREQLRQIVAALGIDQGRSERARSAHSFRSPEISSSALDSQKSLSQAMISLRLALETAVLITFIPMAVDELVKRKGTGRDSIPLSATLRITVPHSLPWDPCTVITQSLYLLGTVFQRSVL